MDEIEKLICYCKKHKSIMCYGAGHYGRIVRAFLYEKGVDIDGFIVSTAVEPGKTVLEAPVQSIDSISNKTEGLGVVVSVAEVHRRELLRNLEERQIFDYFCVSDSLIPILESKKIYNRKYNTDNNVTVFCFHRVANNPLDTWKITETTQLFERQLLYLKENYEILRSEEEWNLEAKKRAAVITFDDGYEDAYSNVLPLLEKYKIPATFFICTGNIGTNNEFWWDELERIIFFADSRKKVLDAFGKQMNIETSKGKEEACYYIHGCIKQMNYKERAKYLARLSEELRSEGTREYCHSLNEGQLKLLSQSQYVTIGGHTVTHSCLAFETEEEQKWEILSSKRRIEEIIGKTIDVFSYPFGQRDDFTKKTVEIAVGCGFKRIFAAYSGVANERTPNGYIPRINIGKERLYEDGIRKLCLFENIYGDESI